MGLPLFAFQLFCRFSHRCRAARVRDSFKVNITLLGVMISLHMADSAKKAEALRRYA